MKKKKNVCCSGTFPTFAVSLLVIGVLWLLAELGYIVINIPWIPIVLIIIAIGIIVNNYNKK